MRQNDTIADMLIWVKSIVSDCGTNKDVGPAAIPLPVKLET